MEIRPMHIPCRTEAVIDLDAIRQNYARLRELFPDTRIMSVIKADGYGHGIAGIVPTCEPLTDAYAAATVSEGIAARDAGAVKPILLFGAVPDDEMVSAAERGLTFSVGSADYAARLNDRLKEHGLTAECHLKIETGMNRNGIRWREGAEDAALCEINAIYALDALRFTGIYTHCCVADSPSADDVAFTGRQYARFLSACEHIGKAHTLGVRHCMASGGALLHPDCRMDMVRVGMLVYGQCDTAEHQRQYGFCEALTWTSCITEIEPLKQGETVSYGRTFYAERDMRIGIVSCGYADGYRRCYQGAGEVLIRGKRARVIGRICMDYLTVDLTDRGDVCVGTPVTLIGTDGTEHISAIEIAEKNASTCGEVTLAITPRVPRRYIGGGA